MSPMVEWLLTTVAAAIGAAIIIIDGGSTSSAIAAVWLAMGVIIFSARPRREA